MKISKQQIYNALWILAIGLILFTPIGFHVRVWVLGQVSTFISADVVDEQERASLGDYQWQLVDIQGNPLDFQSLREEVILVNVWASWCPPCVAEFPSFVELYKDYGDRVAFAFVAHDDKAKVEAFLNKKGYDLPVYFSLGSPPRALGSKSIPATFIISRSGKIAVNETGATNWNSKKTRELLDRLLLE